MNNLKTYLPPQAECVLLQSQENLLVLSNYGSTGQPGSGFGNGSGNVIDDPIFY